jgi:FkbM family methyltransferase
MRRNSAVQKMAYPIAPHGETAGVQWEGTAEHFVGWHAYFRNAYEPETLAVMAAILRPGMRMIEVGANEGYHSVFAAWSVGAEGLVHAYEPYGCARDWIIRNVARLGWQARIAVHAVAVAAAPGATTLYIPDEHEENQGVGGLRVTSVLQTKQTTAQVVTLDAEHESETVGLIKIDVQGGEADVLHGAARLLDRCRPALYFEVGDAATMDAIDVAKESGYVVRRVLSSSHAPFFSLSDDIDGTWFGNCLAIHRECLEVFDRHIVARRHAG